MKKFLLSVIAVCLLFAGLLYLGVMPESFYAFVEESAPELVADIVFKISGVAHRSNQTVDVQATVDATPVSFSMADYNADSDHSYITQAILHGVRNHTEGIVIPLELPSGEDHEITEYFLTQVELAIDIMRREAPEIYWMSLGSYNIEWNGVRETGEGYLTVYLGYCYSPEETTRLAEEMEEIISSLVASAPENEAEAVTYFHDWIVNNTVYASYLAETDVSMQGYEYGFNIDGVFLEGIAVCEGYAKTLKLLCDRVGIPCKTVFGVANEENHSWNYVRLDGKWYLVDATWDDPVGSQDVLLHSYLLMGRQSVIDGRTVTEIYQNDYADYPMLYRYGYYD